MQHKELKAFLEEKYKKFNREQFIETDPISIPRRFSRKEDIEIAGFFAATIAWGQRPTILRNANRLMEWMDYRPFDFLMETNASDWDRFTRFVHRTFNGVDCLCFLHSLQHIYKEKGGLQRVFSEGYHIDQTIKSSIIHFREQFFNSDSPDRTQKHIANPQKGASAKRLNMFLRWMVRQDNAGVDFGLWKDIPASALMMPIDVHSGNVARKLELLSRKQNDWKAVEELTHNLRKFDPMDPVKYDFALFGLGVFEKF